VQYDKYANRQANTLAPTQDQIREHNRAVAKIDLWDHRMLELAGATVVSGAVTAFLWGRSQTRESFSVQPTSHGAAVSFSRSF